tara:strand:+ start:673 stop:1284 length:612 start_codon:yes stop_codon:yes gene_type:complete
MKKDIPIPAEIFYDKRLGHSERILLVTLFSYSNPKTMIAKPSLKGLALRAGFKSVSTVKTVLLNLKKTEWIQVEEKKGSANIYKLSTQPVFGGTVEEGALPSSTFTLSKLNPTNSNTHTQGREQHASRERTFQYPGHSEANGAREENSEKVQRAENETDPGHAGSPRSLGRHPFAVIGELLRRARFRSSNQGSNENESLSPAK